ncbi:MAG: DUF3667 domain-containing protein [Alphaproteobacteria bacterium]|nr:DUF3667 domain-containing protein [Alphaproteobacteria bacterium]MBL6939119.1 DUF3667 domain-containing protein [Alphaproteobacteria bacterium]MBL7096636.1 DUF3667 domain-containing protein [Alphaproteobacteria bacterium]
MAGDIEAILETGSVAAIELAASAMAERGHTPGACANCTKPLVGPYCAVCGQPSKTHRRSVGILIHDLVTDFANMDSRMVRTARALLLQPGELPAAFRRGQTQPYSPAIRLYLFVSLVFFALLSVTNIAIVQFEIKATPQKVIWQNGQPFIANPAYDKNDDDPDARKTIKPLIPIKRAKALRPGGLFNYSEQAHFFTRIGAYRSSLPAAARDRLKDAGVVEVTGPGKKEADWVERNVYGTLNQLAADPAALNGPLTTWLPRVMFLLLPLYALLLALFHIRRRKDFFLVDHLVFSLNIHAFVFVILMVCVGLAQIMTGDTVSWIFFVGMSVYILLAMKRFYAQGWVMTAIKFLGVSAVYCIFFLLPAMVGVLALSVFGGNLG